MFYYRQVCDLALAILLCYGQIANLALELTNEKTIWLPTTNYFQSNRTQLITKSLHTLWRQSKQTKCDVNIFFFERPIKVRNDWKKANTDKHLIHVIFPDIGPPIHPLPALHRYIRHILLRSVRPFIF